MSILDDMWGNVKGVYDDAVDGVSDWWNGTEDRETLPASYNQTAYNERLAEGSAIPVVESAQDADGRTVITAPAQSPLAAYQPYLIGGGILFVVLLVIILMMGRR